MRAVLVVGGRGLRLRPYTTAIPKPLVPVGGEFPLIEVLLRQLRRHGVDRITLATGHLGHLIRNYVGDGSRWGLEVDYWTETTPLGTVGPVLEHLDELPEHFLLLNGDILSNIHFSDLVDFHLNGGGEVTVAASRRRLDIEFGVLDADGSQLMGFEEKPTLEYLVNMGIYVIARDTLREFPAGLPLGADELVHRKIAGGTARVFHFDGYWLDIGRPEDYDRANAEFATLRPLLIDDEEPRVIDLREPFEVEFAPATNGAA